MPVQQTTPEEAHQLLGQHYRYIDVRTEAEFTNAHPAGALNIPIVGPDPATGQMVMNPHFVAVVEAHFAKDAKLIVGCQSGGRSQRAAEVLVAAGYTQVVNMQGGFGGLRDQTGRIVVAGWQECGLPVATDGDPGTRYAHLLEGAKK